MQLLPGGPASEETALPLNRGYTFLLTGPLPSLGPVSFLSRCECLCTAAWSTLPRLVHKIKIFSYPAIATKGKKAGLPFLCSEHVSGGSTLSPPGSLAPNSAVQAACQPICVEAALAGVCFGKGSVSFSTQGYYKPPLVSALCDLLPVILPWLGPPLSLLGAGGDYNKLSVTLFQAGSPLFSCFTVSLALLGLENYQKISLYYSSIFRRLGEWPFLSALVSAIPVGTAYEHSEWPQTQKLDRAGQSVPAEYGEPVHSYFGTILTHMFHLKIRTITLIS